MNAYRVILQKPKGGYSLKDAIILTVLAVTENEAREIALTDNPGARFVASESLTEGI